ncbi:MAG: phosphomannose isomerase type II C-terminal cupin domain [Cyanobacteriota bacterium]|nr:phosphomannose isomerase type II C-terminal cupin domain [Cyanobacteriota bacterium]
MTVPVPSNPEREQRPWGWFETLSRGPDHLVKQLWLEPTCRLSLQRHRHRWEHWVVARGSGMVEINGQRQAVTAGDTLTIAQGAVHRATAGAAGLLIVEVQRGPLLREDDIERLEDDYGRVLSC